MTDARSIRADATYLTVDEFLVDALSVEVNVLLTVCTPKQQAMFLKAYPGGTAVMTTAQLRDAFRLCHRTIRKNREGATP